jgi:4-hydroxymandelate oxidase
MGQIEEAWAKGMSRRKALLALSGMFAASPAALHAQLDPRDFREHRRSPSIDELLDAFDFEEIAYANLPRQIYDYTAQGAFGEWTARRNRHVFDWVDLVEQPGVAPESVDASIEILGIRMEYPILIAPTAQMVPLHPTGEIGMYQAATAARVPMIVSTNSSTPQPDIAAGASGPRWIQLYPSQNLEVTRNRTDMFQEAGAQAIVVTIDQQADWYDRRSHNRWLAGNIPGAGATAGAARQGQLVTSLSGPLRYGVPAPNRMWYTWDFMEQVREGIDVPVLIKGVLSAQDARTCVERGFDGIVVSNHGGRSLDYSPSSLEVLPEIADAVAGRIPVLIDSGFRRGSDALKALALGADAVCFGRGPRWGLAAFGPPGAQRLLEILQAELREAMARTGRRTLAAVDRTAVRTNFA